MCNVKCALPYPEDLFCIPHLQPRCASARPDGWGLAGPSVNTCMTGGEGRGREKGGKNGVPAVAGPLLRFCFVFSTPQNTAAEFEKSSTNRPDGTVVAAPHSYSKGNGILPAPPPLRHTSANRWRSLHWAGILVFQLSGTVGGDWGG